MMNKLSYGLVAWVCGVVLFVLAVAAVGKAQTPPSGSPPPDQILPAEAVPVVNWPRADALAVEGQPPVAMTPLRTAPAASSSEPVSDVDLSAYLDAAAAEVSAASESAGLRFYGFADFSLEYMAESSPYAGESPAFSVGNLNLYAAADIAERWKSLAEIRFTYLPNGAFDSTLRRNSTETPDPANLGASLRWGGISIERAWLEYSAHSLFTIRVGQWLTPVGIWNVDHGTPTIIPAVRPYVVSAGLFPTRQTGVEISGSRLFGETTLGYHVTLSNGRGSADAYMDLDKNKALGGRVFATFMPLGRLTLGASVYAGRSTIGGLATSDSKLVLAIEGQFDELSWAGDLLWQWEGLHLQSEIFAQDVVYTDDGRVSPLISLIGPGFLPDSRRLGGYVLVGYRLPWLTLMPFVELDMIGNGGWEVVQPNSPHEVTTLSGGVNIRPEPAITLKVQFYHLIFRYVEGSDEHINTIKATTAWSF